MCIRDRLRELFAPAPVQVLQIPTAPKTEEAAAPVRTYGNLVLEHPLTACLLFTSRCV